LYNANLFFLQTHFASKKNIYIHVIKLDLMPHEQTLMDSTFQSMNANHILNKQQELDGILKNMRSMRRDNIFLDSVKLEDASV